MACFAINTRVYFGKKQLDGLQKYLESIGAKKLFFIVDKNVADLSAATELVSFFNDRGCHIQRAEGFEVISEPSYDLLDEFTEKQRSRDIDAIMAVGGGSIMDLAKGVGILLKNPGKALDYRGMDRVKIKGVPVVCFPTTAGTGTEVTHTASFIDAKSKTKLGINGKNVSPQCCVLMPELTFSCPESVTLSSGLDAMLHAVEAVSSRNANQMTVMLGSKAFAILYANFREVIAHPDNYDAREEMLLGSYYAGIVMMNAGGGPASGISYPLGVHYKVPHGLAGGIFLPHVFEYNVSKGYKGYIVVYNNLPDADLTLSDNEKSLDFVKKFKNLYKDIGAPETLKSYGWNNINVDSLTELTMKQRKENLDLNPVSFGKAEVRDLISKIV